MRLAVIVVAFLDKSVAREKEHRAVCILLYISCLLISMSKLYRMDKSTRTGMSPAIYSVDDYVHDTYTYIAVVNARARRKYSRPSISFQINSTLAVTMHALV